MRTTMLLAVALVAMVLNAQADMQTPKTVIPNSGLGWEPAGTGAVNLTSKNLDQEVFESGKGAFVNFFAPWCENFPPLQTVATNHAKLWLTPSSWTDQHNRAGCILLDV